MDTVLAMTMHLLWDVFYPAVRWDCAWGPPLGPFFAPAAFCVLLGIHCAAQTDDSAAHWG